MLNAQEIASAVARGRMLMVRGPQMSVGKGPDDFLNTLQEIAKNKEGVTLEQRRKWIMDNANNQQELAAAVRYQVNNDVLAHMWTLGAFQLTTLANEEWPILETVNRDGQFGVWTIGESGGQKKHQFIDRRSHAAHLLRQYSSEKVEYQLLDLQTGSVSAVERIQRELSYELQLGLDAIGLTTLNAIFTTAGSGLRARLNLHKSIVVANVPDSNYLDLSGTAPSGKWTIDKLKSVLDYFQMFADDVELDGAPLAISTIYASSQNRKDFWDFADKVAGYAQGDSGVVTNPKSAVPERVKEEIYRTGKLTNVFGEPINIVARNTIASGTAYCTSNKPVGFFWTKPGMATSDTEIKRNVNKGSMVQTEVYAIAAPDAWSYRAAKVKL